MHKDMFTTLKEKLSTKTREEIKELWDSGSYLDNTEFKVNAADFIKSMEKSKEISQTKKIITIFVQWQ